MKIGIISGSPRKGSQTGRICRHIASRLANIQQDATHQLFDLAEIHLPLWDAAQFDEGSEFQQIWPQLGADLASCDGFIVASPEWAGMVTPHLKNLLLNCGVEMAHKPALLVSVSAGMGGSYPIAELRMSGYKNSHIWWLPDHLILRDVTNLFGDEHDETSQSLNARIDHLLSWLTHSTSALAPVRAACQDLKTYPFGM